ncbi:MAG: hypothetical protein IPK68_09675 [Bdellovibrionales bacterium]|nr:hypothetical protein [Bdellovibrionales bacterium]
MEFEHLYLWMLSKEALSDVALRLILYIQIAHKTGPSPEKRIVYISRRRICKRLSISIGACRSAIKQLVDFGFIRLTDPKGNLVEDPSINWMVLSPKDGLNRPRIHQIIQIINKIDSASDGGSLADPESEGLFDNIMKG